MKKNLFLWKKTQIGKWMAAFCLCAFLVGVTSCKQGVDDDERFSGGVTGVTLESPTLDANSFVTLVNTDGTESVKVTWPVVYGAGGYLFSVDNVNDPANPIAIVSDSIIDGCTGIFEKAEDTRYEVRIKSLANEKLDNKEATSATIYAYSTLLPATTIPSSQDIAEFVAANPPSGDGEQGYELEAGKTYTMNGLVDFDLNQVTFRGDKANRPTVVVGAGGGFVTQAGLKLKYINFDFTASTQTGVLSLSSTPSETISNETLGYMADGATHASYIVEDPVIVQECYFKNVNKSFLYGNKKNWTLRDFRIMDCIIQLNNSTSSSFINLSGASQGLIKNLTIKNNTLYNLVKNSSGNFFQLSSASNGQPKKIFGNGDNSALHILENNTFSHVMSNKDFGNQALNINVAVLNVHNNIFYDVFRLYQYITQNATKYTTGNTIFGTWGGAPNNNDVGGRKDSDGNPFATLEDPEFDGPFEQELDLTQVNGGLNFTPRGSIAVQNKAGDPRWYE